MCSVTERLTPSIGRTPQCQSQRDAAEDVQVAVAPAKLVQLNDLRQKCSQIVLTISWNVVGLERRIEQIVPVRIFRF